jgi:hypothetical protein
MVTAILPANNSISIYNMFLLIQLLCSILITFLAVWSISLFHRCEENDKIDILLLAGRIAVTMVMKTTNVRRTVKANEARSPEFTGIQNTKRFTKLMCKIFLHRKSHDDRGRSTRFFVQF